MSEKDIENAEKNVFVGDKIRKEKGFSFLVSPDSMQKSQVMEESSLVLAFVGDAVHTLYVRQMLIKEENVTAHTQHVRASKFCNAKSQAQALSVIKPFLTDEEIGVLHRARNAKVGTKAKNATISDYHAATAYEALLGFLYLCGENERLLEILKMSCSRKVNQ